MKSYYKQIVEMKTDWISTLKIEDGALAEYVDQEGDLVCWYDTGHGSGVTHHRPMSEDEKVIYQHFLAIEKIYLAVEINDEEMNLKRLIADVEKQKIKIQKLQLMQ